MDEDIETLMIGVRADTAAFAADAATMQSALQGSLGNGADKAGTLIETSLARAIRTGKLGFDDLEKTALAALSQIAASAVSGGVAALFGGSDSGLVSLGGKLVGALAGLPGRATGGPVSPGRAYMVGEQGPELFVPTAAGSIAPAASAGGGRDVRVSITLNAPQGTEPQALARSSRQVARAVSQALARADR
ncbi:MAG TPA: tail tape measure protein [Sphingomonas sp.]